MSTLKAKLPSVKPLKSLQEYMTKYGSSEAAPLYILNQTKQRASILLTVISDRGESLSVLIPYSIAPFDITTIIPRGDLLGSADFKRSLAAGYLRIIDNESAELALNHKVVRAESEKVFKTNQSVLSEADSDSDIQLATHARTLASNENDLSNFHPVVAELLGFDEDDAKANKDRMATILINALSDLTVEDVDYLRKNSKTRELSDIIVDIIEDDEA